MVNVEELMENVNVVVMTNFTKDQECKVITFATPIVNKPCEHDFRMDDEDLMSFIYHCIYCKKTKTEPKVWSMPC